MPYVWFMWLQAAIVMAAYLASGAALATTAINHPLYKAYKAEAGCSNQTKMGVLGLWMIIATAWLPICVIFMACWLTNHWRRKRATR